MSKSVLHLSIDPELIELAKGSGINLSNEFEQWLKIRMNQSSKIIVDYNMEISKRQQEIEMLQAKSQLQDRARSKEEQRIKIIDAIINGQSNTILTDRWKGLQALIRDKMNEIITDQEAIDLLNNRLKDRGL